MTDYLGDKSFEELGIVMLQSYQHPVPSTRDMTLTIPGRHGTYDFGATLDSRYFDLPVALIENDSASVQKGIRVLTTHLFDSKGKPKIMKLIFDEEPEKHYWVRYGGSMPIQRIVGVGIFSLPLIAFDPFAYAEQSFTPSYVDTNLRYDTGQTYEPQPNALQYGEMKEFFYENVQEFEWKYSRHYSFLHNHSDYESSLIIEVEGTVINPRITNLTTGKKIFLPSISNKLLQMDSGKFLVKVEGISNFTDYRGDFLVLAPGTNDLVFEGGLPDAVVRYNWQHKFL